MVEKIVFNYENGIFNFIMNMLNEKNKSKYIVFSQIEDQTMEKIDNCLKEKIDDIYICVDRYLTTKNLFESLLKNDKFVNKRVYSNSEINGNKLNNLIIVQTETHIEVLIIPFVLSYFNLSTSNSFAIYLCGEKSDASILETILKKYINQSEYCNLTSEYIKECEVKKLFRNEKASTIYKDVNKDEVIHSFRTITDLDNADETLKIIQSQNNAKKFSLEKSEISFNINDEEIKINDNISFNDDIEIDIEV